jgi:hypothetical protein
MFISLSLSRLLIYPLIIMLAYHFQVDKNLNEQQRLVIDIFHHLTLLNTESCNGNQHLKICSLFVRNKILGLIKINFKS